MHCRAMLRRGHKDALCIGCGHATLASIRFRYAALALIALPPVFGMWMKKPTGSNMRALGVTSVANDDTSAESIPGADVPTAAWE